MKAAWVPVTERLPEQGILLLVWLEDSPMLGCYKVPEGDLRFVRTRSCWRTPGGSAIWGVTHWQPIEGPETNVT